MTGGIRWFSLFFALCVASGLAFAMQGQSHEQGKPPTITQEGLQLFQLGQRAMGQNNPAYALRPDRLDPMTRNDAGAQAVHDFRQLTTQYPKFAEGWLWLGIALTERLHYSKRTPDRSSAPPHSR